MNGPQPFLGCDGGLDPPNEMISGIPHTSSRPSDGSITMHAGPQLYRVSDGLSACSPEVAIMDRHSNGARTYPRSNKDISQSWSQISSSLDSGSCDEVFSDMSPRTAYSNGSNPAMRAGTTQPGIWCQTQAQDGPPLDYWWEDGCDVRTILSQNDACPEVSLDDMEFSPQDSTWLDDLFLNDNNLTRSGIGNLLLSPLGENHDPILPGMTGSMNSAAEGSGHHEYGSTELSNSASTIKNPSYSPTIDRWSSLMTVDLSRHQNSAKGVHSLQSTGEPSGNRRMDQQRQSPEGSSLRRPSREKQPHKNGDHKSGSNTPKTWSTRQKIQRIRVQSKPQCAPRPDAKDIFLVQSKLAGMSYREIRDRGNFTEAESTLRGRFRTLTKDKENRVRKPEWQERDVKCPLFSPFRILDIF